MFRCHSKSCGRLAGTRGFSLVEVIIAVFILVLLSLITVTGMMFHARMAQSNLAKMRMAEGARRFIEGAQIAILDSTNVRVDTGPAGANTVLTLESPDPANASNVVVKQYAYLDGDGNPATIGDNRIVERNVDTPMATAGKVLVEYCSPVNATTSIFSKNPDSPRPLYEVKLRVGDRTNPANNADNAFTGKGYQSFLIDAGLAKI